MDQFITWFLSLVALISACFAIYYEIGEWRVNTKREDQWRVLMLVLVLLSFGTFAVSSLALVQDTADVTIFAGFNRAILAGAGIYVAVKSHQRRRGRSGR